MEGLECHGVDDQNLVCDGDRVGISGKGILAIRARQLLSCELSHIHSNRIATHCGASLHRPQSAVVDCCPFAYDSIVQRLLHHNATNVAQQKSDKMER